MELTGSRHIDADRATVWAHLNSAETLKECIAGCEELAGSPEDGFDAVVVQKVGPVKARFKGRVELSEIDAPNSYRLSGEGKGGVAGFAKGGAYVTLEETEEGGTLLTYEVEARVGGKLAQLGNRIIKGFARKMVDKFFTRFQEVAGGGDQRADASEG
ncbi:MAG TPA: carbon monoxide dehydrogenase [Aliiroseovarius sp.]|nr:carbon monoxide dehydrogenase [Aliiroseovarius sp.]